MSATLKKSQLRLPDLNKIKPPQVERFKLRTALEQSTLQIVTAANFSNVALTYIVKVNVFKDKFKLGHGLLATTSPLIGFLPSMVTGAELFHKWKYHPAQTMLEQLYSADRKEWKTKSFYHPFHDNWYLIPAFGKVESTSILFNLFEFQPPLKPSKS